MKIVIFEVEAWERPAFEKLGPDHEVVTLSEALTPHTLADYSDAEIISTFIYSQLDRGVLERFERLRLICTRSTGFDHIDLDFCRERAVAICNVPTYGQNTVAEHVFGLLLTLSHKLDQAVERTRRGDFSLKGLQGFDLFGKTLGVIGTGDIGRCVIRIARGFGMKVVAYDVNPNEALARELGFLYVGLNDLLAVSDVISLHVPDNPKTRHMISWEQFERMKPGVVLINTARGQVIHTQSLIRALAEGKVSGAGLDVLPEEPVIREEAELLRSVYQRNHDLENLLADHILLRLRNIIVTPHSAFNTREAVQRIIDVTIENIVAFAAGRPQNVVKPKS